MRCIRLDCAWMGDREAVHDYLAQALGFPSWYGRNLDALYDLLTGWMEPTRLELKHLPALTAYPYGEKVLETLQDAAANTPGLEIIILSTRSRGRCAYLPRDLYRILILPARRPARPRPPLSQA